MALTYLSGDENDFEDYMDTVEISGKGRRRRKARRAARKAARKTKKSVRKTRRVKKRTVRKAKRAVRKKTRQSRPRRGIFKKVIKIAAAPARGAFITALSLNALGLAKKVARVWNKPGGKAALEKFWVKKFGGRMKPFKKALSRGAKQRFSADEIGAAPIAVVLAAATPVVLALTPILKMFKAGGGKNEKGAFDLGVKDALQDAVQQYGTTNVEMDEDADVGVIPGGGGSDYDDDENGNVKGSLLSPVGFCFKSLLMVPMMGIENPVLLFLAGLISSYSIIGLAVAVPLMVFNPFGLKAYGEKYFNVPAAGLVSLINYFKHGAKKTI